jgi:hypothetical protein
MCDGNAFDFNPNLHSSFLLGPFRKNVPSISFVSQHFPLYQLVFSCMPLVMVNRCSLRSSRKEAFAFQVCFLHELQSAQLSFQVRV